MTKNVVKKKGKPKKRNSEIEDDKDDNDDDNNDNDDDENSLKVLSKKVLRIQKNNINHSTKSFIVNDGVVVLSVY